METRHNSDDHHAVLMNAILTRLDKIIASAREAAVLEAFAAGYHGEDIIGFKEGLEQTSPTTIRFHTEVLTRDKFSK